MTTARITRLLPSKSLIETTLLTAAFITIQIAAYLDREQDIESSSPISLSLTSQLLASCHTAAACVKVLENFERAGIHFNPSYYKRASATMLLSSLGTLTGVWATADSKVNLALGIANATSNCLARVFSSAHRKAVMFDLEVNFDSLIDEERNANMP